MNTNDDAVKDIKKAKDALDNINSSESKTILDAKYPDAKKHKYISFVKSGLRIVAFGFLAYYEIQIAAGLLLLAELLGVYEEMV